MGGRSSRNKGKVGEYLVRDYFRARGYVSNRVPSSGAALGFKGDVVLEKDGRKLLAEVKFRKDEYKSIYALLDQSEKPLLVANKVILSDDFSDLGFEPGSVQLYSGSFSKHTKAVSKLINMEKLLKTADFLVIKINHKPLLFIRYV
jgi:hypothetical protein